MLIAQRHILTIGGNGSGIAVVGDFQHQSSIDVLPFV